MIENQLGMKLDTKGSGTKDRTITLGMASLWLAQNVQRVARSMTLSEYLGGGK
jgi:hypothetical protein